MSNGHGTIVAQVFVYDINDVRLNSRLSIGLMSFVNLFMLRLWVMIVIFAYRSLHAACRMGLMWTEPSRLFPTVPKILDSLY